MNRPFHRSPACLALLVLVVALLVARYPARFIAPALFNEEATVYFKSAYQLGWNSLWLPHQGYYSLLGNLAGYLMGAVLPIEFAGYVATALGTLVLLWLFALIVAPGSPFETPLEKTLATLLALLVLPGACRLHVSYFHFPMALCALLVLVSKRRAAWERGIHRITLLTAGLTGVVALFLLPIFAWKWYRSRAREDRLHFMVLVFCAGVQAIAIWVSAQTLHGDLNPANRLADALHPDVYNRAIFAQSLVLPFSGYRVAESVGAALAASYGQDLLESLGLVVVNLGWIWLLAGGRRRLEPAVAYSWWAVVLVLALSLIGSTTRDHGPKLSLIDVNHRYHAVPNVIAGFVLLRQAFTHPGRAMRAVYLGSVLWLLGAGAYSWIYEHERLRVFTAGPPWYGEVKRWQNDPDAGLHFGPRGLALRFTPDRSGPKDSGL